MENVWIVIVDFNGIEDTRKCLRSLQEVVPPASVIVVDNGSIRDVTLVLKPEFPKTTFFRSRQNTGWAGGNNIGLRYALARGAECVVLLNNDTTVSPHLVERLMAAARSHPEYGILGPVIRFMDPPSEVQTDGVQFNRVGRPGFFQRQIVPLTTTPEPVVTEVDIVNGCCLMVRRDLIASIGFIDEEFFLVHEESDLCLRSQRAGFKNGVVGEALVWHKGSSTFQREGKRLQRYYDSRNLIRLLARHWDRRTGRSMLLSALLYFRYAYHRYAIEREHGYASSAEAIVEGVYDAWTRRFGQYSHRPRFGISVVREAFDLVWRLAGEPKVVPTSATPSML